MDRGLIRTGCGSETMPINNRVYALESERPCCCVTGPYSYRSRQLANDSYLYLHITKEPILRIIYIMSTLLSSLLGGEPLGTFTPSCSTETFAAMLADSPGATVNYAEAVPQNGSFGDAATNLLFPFNATQLPALCAVGINVKSSANSSYNFGLFLPDTTWNGRIMTTGNGGYGGGINW